MRKRDRSFFLFVCDICTGAKGAFVQIIVQEKDITGSGIENNIM